MTATPTTAAPAGGNLPSTGRHPAGAVRRVGGPGGGWTSEQLPTPAGPVIAMVVLVGWDVPTLATGHYLITHGHGFLPAFGAVFVLQVIGAIASLIVERRLSDVALADMPARVAGWWVAPIAGRITRWTRRHPTNPTGPAGAAGTAGTERS